MAPQDELLAWLESQRRHVVDQVRAMPPEARRRSHLPSGWTPRGLVHHLTLDVELLDRYVEEGRLATSAMVGVDLDASPAWWFPGGEGCPYATLREVLLHVLVETATHAGHLDIVRELVDGGQRLVLDEPPGAYGR